MESLLPLCSQSVGESNLFPCLCRVGILLLFEFDTLWSPLTVMLTFCPTHGNYTFFPYSGKEKCQLVNVGILLLKCECQRGGSSRTVPHIVHREGEKYQWDDICSKTTWLDGTLLCTGMDIHAMPKHLMSYRFVFVFRKLFCIIIAEREILWVFGCIYIYFLAQNYYKSQNCLESTW